LSYSSLLSDFYAFDVSEFSFKNLLNYTILHDLIIEKNLLFINLDSNEFGTKYK